MLCANIRVSSRSAAITQIWIMIGRSVQPGNRTIRDEHNHFCVEHFICVFGGASDVAREIEMRRRFHSSVGPLAMGQI